MNVGGQQVIHYHTEQNVTTLAAKTHKHELQRNIKLSNISCE